MIQNTLKYLIIAFATLAVISLLWFFETIVMYVLFSVIFSLIGQPFVKMFRKIRVGNYTVPSSVSALGALLCLVLIFALLISLFIPLAISEARIISSVNTWEVMDYLKAPLNDVGQFLNQFIPEKDARTFQENIQNRLISVLSFSRISDFINAFLYMLGDIAVAVFSISFITFFFLKDEHMFYNIVIAATPSRHEEAVKNIMAESRRLLTRYFVGICIEVILIVFLVAVGLSVLGVKNALIIAVLSGVLNIIPYVGPIIGLGIGLVIGISTNIDFNVPYEIMPLVYKIMGVFLTVQLLDGLFLAPLIYSNSVKAHPLEIFIVLLAAGNIGGVGAMIVAIPAYTLIRIIARQFFNNFKIVQKLTQNLGD